MTSMKKLIMTTLIAGILASTLAGAAADPTVRIKDIAKIEGARSNQIYGYGLVVGLDGSGDSQQAIFTAQSVANMLQQFGITVPLARVRVRNVAAVMVTADLPPFVRPGSRIDVVVSSIGDAKSLQGGTLLQTPLQAANGRVYAVAQGSVSLGGFAATGGGSTVQKNHTTVGRVPGGAIIEQEAPSSLVRQGSINVLLNNPDFATAARVAQAINRDFAPGSARALDAATIEVNADAHDPIAVIASIGELSVVGSSIARVIINERTGTVVIGGGVRLSPVAISHGGLSVEISTETQVSQPPPFAETGETVVVEQTAIEIREEKSQLVQIEAGATLEELVRALNTMKVTPRDIIAIFQALKQAGALHAELEII